MRITLSSSTAGAYFACCAHLGASSAHAFRRLARELSHHGAPEELVASAEHAALAEIEHTRTMEALATRFGDASKMLVPLDAPPRALFEVALENAVEGCVRETYGAALVLLHAARSCDAEVRAALASLARDECGHGETSWAVLRWTMSKLSSVERAEIVRAMHEALDPGTPSRAEKQLLLQLVTTHVLYLAVA
jgi:hypothetical protein